jgi:hypothetical protein
MALRAAIIAATLAVMATPAVAQWADWPGPSDADLERIVRSAYSAAAAYAKANGNYFSPDGEYEPLTVAIGAGLAKDGFASVAVPDEPVVDLDAARKCISGRARTELRFAITLFGDALTLAATTGSRTFSYHYDPHEAPAIVVAPAARCLK